MADQTVPDIPWPVSFHDQQQSSNTQTDHNSHSPQGRRERKDHLGLAMTQQQLLAMISRNFFRRYRIYRYRMKKIDSLSDQEVIQCCHWFCEDHRLTEDFSNYRNEIESSFLFDEETGEYTEKSPGDLAHWRLLSVLRFDPGRQRTRRKDPLLRKMLSPKSIMRDHFFQTGFGTISEVQTAPFALLLANDALQHSPTAAWAKPLWNQITNRKTVFW